MSVIVIFTFQVRSQLTEQFLQGFHDENDSHQSSEGLLSEPGEVSHDGREVQSDDDETEQGGPQSYPESHGEVVDFIIFTEVYEDLLEDEDGASAAEYCERLTSEQTEHSTGYEVTKERLEDSLHTVKRSELATANWSSPGVPP